MRESAERLGDPVLYEQYEWIAPETGYAAIEALPSSWLFSEERIHQVLFPQPAQAVAMPPARRGPAAVEMRPKASGSAIGGLREVVLTA
jgi:hypothetical protein